MTRLINVFKGDKASAIVLFILSFIVYSNTLGHDFALDDSIVISENQFVKEGLSGLDDIFSRDTFYGFFKRDGKDNLVQGGRYRPLSLAFFALEYQLFGLSPFVGHLFNIIFYGGLVLFIFFFLKYLFKNQSYGRSLAFWAAVVFAVHPIHTEVVANIKGRDEILALLFSLGSFYYVLKSCDKKALMNSILGVVLIFLGSMSKENAITFAAIIPLGLILFRQKSVLQALRHSLPVFIGIAGFMAIRFSVLGFELGSSSMELMNNPFLKWTGTTYVEMSLSEKLPIILYSLGEYIRLLVFPVDLNHDYYPRHIEIMSWTDWRVILSVLVYLGLAYIALRAFKKKPIWSFSIFFFVSSLSIVSNLFISVGTNMAERFVFMPSLGFSIALGYAIVSWLMKEDRSSPLNFNLSQLLLVIIPVILFSGLTLNRNKVWKDNYTLFTSDVNKDSRSAKLCNSAGGAIIDRFKDAPDAQKKVKLEEAKLYLERAIDIHPTYKNAYLLRGNAAYYLFDFEDAIKWFEKALALDPSYEEARNNIFEAYLKGGEYAGQKENNLPKAIQYLTKAESLSSGGSYELNRLLGIAYGLAGETQRAVTYFDKCVELEPNNPWSYYNLLTAYANLKNQEKVTELENKILELDPEFFVKLKNR